MIRRSFRVGLTLGVLAGLGYALAKMLGARSAHTTDVAPTPSEPWPPLRPEPPAATPAPAPVVAAPAPVAPVPVAPEEVESDPEPVAEAPAMPAPVKKAPAKKAAAKKPATVWVEPSGDVCPTSHPVKAKLSSRIFHLPGMLNYERTRPDRCYRDAGSAEADGLRAAKR